MFLSPTKRTNLALALSSALLLSACATQPALRGPASPEETVTRGLVSWPEPVVEREGVMSLVLMSPMTLPAEVAAQSISLRLEPRATVRDLSAALAAQGLNVLVSDAEAGSKEFYLPRFDGQVGSLFRMLSRSLGVFFTWQDGVVVVSQTERFAVSIPQEEKLAATLSDGIQKLGGTAIAHSSAGMLVFEATPRVYEEVRLYIERVTQNSALVTLEVALLSVTLNDDNRRGVDWESFTLALGKGSADLLPKDPAAEVPTTTDGATGEMTGGTTAAAPKDARYAGLTGGALKAGILSDYVSVSAVMNFLDAYGTTETLQNVRTKTLSGHEAELSNVTQIPYIRSVGATSAVGGSSSTVTGSSEAATAEDGITFKLLPTYDRDANTVTLALNLSVNSVLGFNELSAGNQIGKLTQPTTAKRELTDTLRIRPGQTAVIGGVIYESLSDSRSTLAGVERIASRGLSKKRNEMFIVIRPTVSQFGKLILPAAQPAVHGYLPSGVHSPASAATGLVPKSDRLVTPGGVQVELNSPTTPASTN